jgi:DNA polymerase III alpha subunit
MKTDNYGQQVFNEADLCDFFLQDPSRSINQVLVEKSIEFDDILNVTNIPNFKTYSASKLTSAQFDEEKQSHWYMPEEYASLDIAKWVLEKCYDDAELQRAGDELLKFHDRGMFPLLQYLKYLVDTMRQHNIVWGVGRGSSVSSFVLYLIGIHKINSLYYDLSIDEFLK